MPWRYEDSHRYTRIGGVFYNDEGQRIGLFGTAAAHLIAAAPELLEVLKATARMYHAKAHVEANLPYDLCTASLCITTRAVIAKAQGGGYGGGQ